MLFEDLVRAIRDSPFFHGMAPDEQMSLARLGGVDVQSTGGVLFRPGEVPAALYLVLDGVVEICRVESAEVGPQPVAYLGVGSTLSEAKVLTGTALTSLAHFPEGGTTLQWPRPILLRQLYTSRDFALHYLQSLARRLEGTVAHLGAQSGSNLRGRLENFDLPAILQTVVDSGATGVLEVNHEDGRCFGAIHTHEKMIGRISCGDLTGSEAFLEILTSPPTRGTFRFSTLVTPAETGQYLPVQPLLIEAARIQDEFSHFGATVPATAFLRPSARHLVWGSESNEDLVEQIWHQLSAQPCGWGTLAELLPYSRGQVGLAVRDMLLAGVITVDRAYEVPPAENIGGWS
jgi:CRP-like cAMP-binding protein